MNRTTAKERLVQIVAIVLAVILGSFGGWLAVNLPYGTGLLVSGALGLVIYGLLRLWVRWRPQDR